MKNWIVVVVFFFLLLLRSGKTAKQIVAGEWHTCIILNDDTLKCWGKGEYGALGYGDTNNRGDEPHEMGNNLPIVDLGTDKTAKQIAAGKQYTCVILNDNTVKCWGDRIGVGYVSYSLEMGDNLPTVELGTGKTAKQLVAAMGHVCVILNDDTVKCWGKGQYGALGYGDTTSRTSPPSSTVDLGTGKTAKQIAASLFQNHNCVILNDDTVKCWGWGYWGQLGYGDTSTRGDEPNEMGDNLPTVDLGTGKTAKQVVAGSSHTCAILNDDTVKCWGGGYGELGYGDSDNRGDEANEMGDNLPTVDLGTGKTAKQIVAGGDNTCVILNDDTVKCWGRGHPYGQLGYGDTSTRGDEANEMGDNLPTVDLGTGKTAKQLVAGRDHTCVILNDDTNKCWGGGEIRATWLW